MPFGIKQKSPSLVKRLNRPAGKNARHLRNVGLGIASIHAQGVQFHQFAAVILIQAARGSIGLGWLAWPHTVSLGVWPDAEPIIEVVQHGRALGYSLHQIAEFAQRVGTDHITLVAGDEILVLVFVDKYVEVIEPEVRQ